jgi:hypothetical protein
MPDDPLECRRQVHPGHGDQTNRSYGGNIRIDPAPRWNRTSDAILVPGIATNGTRQLFVIRVVEAGRSPSTTAIK